MFLCIPNLVSRAVVPCVPWEFNQPPPDAVKGKGGKAARDKWISNKETSWQVYTAFEGIIPNLRITESKSAGDEGNPPLKLHAFVADFDAPLTEDEIAQGLERVAFKPNYLERTLSGNVRLVWLFEKAVAFPNSRFAKEFLQHALKKTGFDSIAVKLDIPAWEDPKRMWTNSGVWLQVQPEARISHALLQGWVMEVSEKHLWKKDRGAVDIPLPAVWTELCKKFPELPAQWPTEFVEGAMGPTFWVEGSTSPKSAIVKPTGMFTFSATATKPFYSWADLVGVQFVQRYQEELLGKAVEGIWYDGRSYWRTTGYGKWQPFAKEDIQSHLAVDRGLSTVKENGSHSEVARAIQYIQNWRSVEGAAPFVYMPAGLIERGGKRFVNTSTLRVCRPHNEPVTEADFPFLAAFLKDWFSSDDQRPFFVSWLARYYQAAYKLSPNQGQSVAICGPTNRGKTMWLQGVIPRLFGNSANAEHYLQGDTRFNSELFAAGVWTVDDSTGTNDSKRRSNLGLMMKQMTANSAFTMEAKFANTVQVVWCGRIMISLNADESSLRAIPDLDISNRDKISLFRLSDTSDFVFPERAEIEVILDREMPYFARYLLDFQIPEQCRGDSRFGIKVYHEPSLLQAAEHSSRSAVFQEILEDWQDRYFADSAKSALGYWTGNSFQFLQELLRQDGAREALRGWTPDKVSIGLMSLKSKGFAIETSESQGRSRQWRISKPKPVQFDHVGQTENSLFQKRHAV